MMREHENEGEEIMMCAVAGNRGIGRVMCLGIPLALFFGISLAAQAVWAGGATDAMKGTIDEVLRIVQDKELRKPAKAEERRKLLEQIVGERFDYSEMSRRALGAPWAKLSDKEKDEFVGLFQTLLVNSYADKVEAYSGEGVEYINERTEKDYAEVRTKVLRRQLWCPQPELRGRAAQSVHCRPHRRRRPRRPVRHLGNSEVRFHHGLQWR